VSFVFGNGFTALDSFLTEQATALVNGASTEVVIPKVLHTEELVAGDYTLTITVSNFLGGVASQVLAVLSLFTY
jgi:hypothetical protein